MQPNHWETTKDETVQESITNAREHLEHALTEADAFQQLAISEMIQALSLFSI